MIGNLGAFIATSFSGLFTPETAGAFRLSSMGAIGALRSMTGAGALDVIPVHVSQVAPTYHSEDAQENPRFRRKAQAGMERAVDNSSPCRGGQASPGSCQLSSRMPFMLPSARHSPTTRWKSSQPGPQPRKRNHLASFSPSLVK